MSRIREFATRNGGGEVKGGDCVFLDDIGENLRAAKKTAGWRTIKVELGREKDVVEELASVLERREDGKSKL